MYKFKVAESIEAEDKDILRQLKTYARQDFVTLDDHFSWRHRQLKEDVRRKRSIYLDQKYWIYFRDIETGKSNHKAHRRILNLLRSLISEGSVFCPASSSTLHETDKIKDEQRRTRTAALIDELSLGIGLRNISDRMKIEFFNSWDCLNQKDTSTPIVIKDVWTSIALAHGVPLGNPPSFIPPRFAKASGKLIIDELMDMTFSEAMRLTHSDELDEALRSNPTADEINSDRKFNTTKLRFTSEFPRECLGLISSDIFMRNGLIVEPTYYPDSVNGRVLSVECLEVLEFIANLLGDVCKNGEARKFPTMYLWSGLHTKGKEARASYSMNEIFDYDHGWWPC